MVINSTTKDLHAILRAPNGQFEESAVLENPGAMLTNSAMTAGVAGITAQVVMQQTIYEITDYRAIIDEEFDDVLRAQKDAVLSDMIGVGPRATLLSRPRGRAAGAGVAGCSRPVSQA
ncbi:hypothetical protein [Microbacterium sp. LWH13-1.2]|uniref:hypothetical protein n=1 Tax=Microbacterium sp. LWH13-1.2 TaxID=3135260 RepID=UPI00313936FB